MHHLLLYTVTPDYPTRRAQFRQAHLALAWQAVERGELVLGGACGDPPEGAMLLFSTDNADIPAAFAKADPYVLNGLVTAWRVIPWHTVVGHEAPIPVRPD